MVLISNIALCGDCLGSWVGRTQEQVIRKLRLYFVRNLCISLRLNLTLLKAVAKQAELLKAFQVLHGNWQPWSECCT